MPWSDVDKLAAPGRDKCSAFDHPAPRSPPPSPRDPSAMFSLSLAVQKTHLSSITTLGGSLCESLHRLESQDLNCVLPRWEYLHLQQHWPPSTSPDLLLWSQDKGSFLWKVLLCSGVLEILSDKTQPAQRQCSQYFGRDSLDC